MHGNSIITITDFITSVECTNNSTVGKQIHEYQTERQLGQPCGETMH